MPNEQTFALEKTIENLKEQLEKQKQLSEEKIQNLIDSFASEKVRSTQNSFHLNEKNILMEKNLEKIQRILHQTTKDYLILRHHSQEMERTNQEEMQFLREQCEQLLKEKKNYTKQTIAETEALREAVREENEQQAEEYRHQTLAREREVLILKEQYASIQETYHQRIKDLQTRLTKLRIRYKALEKRRKMEMEGFTRDIFQLKKKLQKLETFQYVSSTMLLK
jgi:coiled-coil domain-containing protein 77